jgi:phosphatidylglycerophosphate synthase
LLLVVAAVILLIQGYRAFPPSLLGKATTFFEIALVFYVVFAAAYPSDRAETIIRYLTYIVAAFVVTSGFHYAFAVSRRLHAS